MATDISHLTAKLASHQPQSGTKPTTKQERGSNVATLFSPFGRLPQELRFQVYELAFPRRVLRFHPKWLPGEHQALLLDPPGPPAIAQACREAWAFAAASGSGFGSRYWRLTYRPAEIRAMMSWSDGVGGRGRSRSARRPRTPTWFHPAVDVLYADVPWNDVVHVSAQAGGTGARLVRPPPVQPPARHAAAVREEGSGV